jgi:hypothetical protein
LPRPDYERADCLNRFARSDRCRRNLAIGVDFDEGPQSIRKLLYPEIKNFGKPPCLLLIKGLGLP